MIRSAMMFALFALFLAGFGTACDSGVPSDEHYFDNFRTVVAQAPNEGWTPYWLGRSFDAGGITFSGPYVADFGDELSGGAQFTYSGPGGSTLEFRLYSPASWVKASPIQGLTSNTPSHDVQVAGNAAKLALLAAGTRPVNEARLYVRFGDTMVVAIAHSGGAATPGGPDANPLIDEQTFLGVLQHLRPYPK